MNSKKKKAEKLIRLLHNNELSYDELTKALAIEEKELAQLIDMLMELEFISFENNLYRLNYKTFHEMNSIVQDSSEDMSKSLKTGLMENLVHQREDTAERIPITVEIAFYNNVSDGNIDKLNAMYKPIATEGFGKLSKNRLQNVKYHLVISTAVIARFCINKGMSMEESYNISDTYIQRADACKSEEEVQRLHYEASLEYAKRMNRMRFNRSYSMIMIKIIDYICSHLHERILIQDIAEHVSRSVPYISRLFSAEMGMTASDYIMKQKIDAAAEMLLLTERSITEIAAYYSFSSSSHFTKQFKNEMGVSPKDFRQKYVSVAWARKNSKAHEK